MVEITPAKAHGAYIRYDYHHDQLYSTKKRSPIRLLAVTPVQDLLAITPLQRTDWPFFCCQGRPHVQYPIHALHRAFRSSGVSPNASWGAASEGCLPFHADGGTPMTWVTPLSCNNGEPPASSGWLCECYRWLWMITGGNPINNGMSRCGIPFNSKRSQTWVFDFFPGLSCPVYFKIVVIEHWWARKNKHREKTLWFRHCF